LQVPVGAAGQDLVKNVSAIVPEPQPQGPPQEGDLGELAPGTQDVIRSALGVAGDIANITPAAALTKGAASGVADVLRNGIGDAGEAATSAGLRNGAGAPITRAVAGSSGKSALTIHNSQMGSIIAGNEAGITTPGTPVSYDSLSTAREGPNSVYNRVANALPEGPLDTQAITDINNSGVPQGGRISAGSPQAQAQIDALKAQLSAPQNFTGNQMVNELRALRQEGYTNIGSDDVSNQQLGNAQLDMANAAEGHIGRNLPAGGDVDLPQFQDARKTLAKNFAVQGALRGNDVNLAALARIQRADPNLLDGGLKTLADFANANPDVTGTPAKYNAPSFAQDLQNISLAEPGSIVRAAGTGPIARRLLTGSPGAAASDAAAAFPPRNPADFAPLPPPPLPNWTLGENAPAPATAQPPGGFSLADLLSHGVEQEPPAGLTAGPMGSPAPNGVPFTVPPESVGMRPAPGGPAPDRTIPNTVTGVTGEQVPTGVARVPLGNRFTSGAASLADDLLGSAAQQPNSDNAKVISQGVPEDIAQRTPNAMNPEPIPLTEGGGYIFRSPNGHTIARKRGNTLQISATATQGAAQGQGEATARMEDAIRFAQAHGLNVASDTKVSNAAAKIYNRLESQGYQITRNEAEPDGKGNLVSTDGRPIFQVTGLPPSLGDLLGAGGGQ
jgi:hypothetical protein